MSTALPGVQALLASPDSLIASAVAEGKKWNVTGYNVDMEAPSPVGDDALPVIAFVNKLSSALAKEGIILTNHYTHWHCSPTRRSFLTGRLPIHHGEQLSGDATDDIDLRMEWVSDKLHTAGYQVR